MKMEANRNSDTTLTQIKYEKTSCYFCNEWLDSLSFKEHLIHCSQVLEKCPNSCSAYVQRKKMRTHLMECPKEIVKTNGKSESPLLNLEIENRLLTFEQDLTSLRSVLNEEIRQRLHLITDVGCLRKHNQITNEWTQKIGEVLENLRKCINEETTTRCNELEQCHQDCRLTFDLSQTLKLDVQSELENFQKQIGELSYEMKKGVNRMTENIIRLEENMKFLEKNFRSKIKSLESDLNLMAKDLQMKFVSNTDLNTKQVKLDFEVMSMKNIVCSTEEKCDKLEEIVCAANTATHQTQQSLEDLQEHLKYENKMNAIQNTKGHLLWRIGEFVEKLNDAKVHDTVQHSPIFCNKPFGYTMRMDVHLNGKGTWRGRNIIACINVISGEFDPLLQWPCKLQADLIIRDQSDDLTMAQDYVKTIIVKRKNDDFQSNQYFHIPHKVLQSRNYLRNDAIFFEIRIHKK